MSIPFVKEWGSWVVFVSSWIAALITGLAIRPWLTGREFILNTFLTILGLTLLINSKNPLVAVIRTKGENVEQLKWLLFFVIAGTSLLIPFIADGLGKFLIFSFLILSYMLMLSIGKEHHVLAELNGFALITLPAPIIYYVVTGEMSIKLYVAVFMFFAAGVFKVKVRIRKTADYRLFMGLYVSIVTIVYYFYKIPIILLVPLLENIISILWMREEALKTTGYIELTKGIMFLVLLGLYW